MQNLFSQTFAKDRTESDILSHAHIPLMLGKKEHKAKPLTIRKCQAWREKVADLLNGIATGALTGTVTSQSFMQGIMVAFFKFPEQVLELLIAFSPELEEQREWLYDNATDEEVVVAFSRVLAVAYPYFNLLGQMRTAATATDQATSRQ
jgi:hypothetical protein